MRLRALILVVSLLVAGAVPAAGAVPLQFDPPRVSGAPGQVVSVRITPLNQPENIRQVFFVVDRASVAGRLTVMNRGPEVSRRGPTGALRPVTLQLRIEAGASGDIPVSLKVMPLEGQQNPDQGRPELVPNAFVVAVAGGGQAPAAVTTPQPLGGAQGGDDFTLTVTPSEPGPMPPAIPEAGRITLKVRVESRGGDVNDVQIRPEAPQGLLVAPKDCPPDRPGCSGRSTKVELKGRKSAEAEFVVLATPGSRGGQIVFEAKSGRTGKRATFDVRVQPGLPQAPSAPSFPMPVGPVTTSYVPPEIAGIAARIDRETQHLDGLAETLKSGQQEGLPPEQAATQGAFLQLNDQIIQQLRNPVGLVGTNELGDPEMDPQVLADFIEATGIFERDAARREAMQQIASLGGPAVLPLIAYDAEIERPQLGAPVRWSEYSTIEALLVKILLRRMAENIQPGTERMREVMGKIEEGIEKMGGEEAEGFKKAKALFRPLALAGTLVTVADVAGKAALALMPSEITHFYTLINDTPREPGADPVVINVGQEMPIKVLILTRSPGGTIATPSEVAGWIWDNMPDETKKKVADKAKLPEMKGQLQQDVKKWLTEKLTSNPTVKSWIESVDKAFDIPGFAGTPVEVNSTRVIEMTSRDESKLEIVARPDGQNRKRFFMIGKRETAKGEAGYEFGLRPSTFAALKDADKTKFGLHGIRANVTVHKPLTCNDTGTSCTPSKAEEAQSNGTYTPEGAQWWKLVCSSGPPKPGEATRPAGPCSCKCVFLAPY